MQDVAVDSGHVYWANEGRANNGTGNNTGTIGRANLNGSGANQRFITNGTRLARGVAVDGHHVYWTHSPPPDTTVYAGPSGVTNDPTPTFAFYSSDGGSSFECKLDRGAYSACASPKRMGHLADGPHTFYVRAKDAAGNLDPTPASRSFTVRTAEVHILGSTLVVKAATGAKDNLRVSRPSASDLLVTDFPGGPYTGSGVHAWGGCTRSGDHAAHCDAAGIRVIQVSLGGRTDKVVNSTAVGSWLSGGTADDSLIGGSNSDTLLGGPGADVLKGMNGNDLLRGQDRTDDTTINCDGGTAPGGADKAVLDPLPKDSPASGCETVTRQSAQRTASPQRSTFPRSDLTRGSAVNVWRVSRSR